MELLIAMLVLLPLPAWVYAARRAARRERRYALWSATPTEVTDNPFRGYKIAQIVSGDRNAYLMGVLDVRYDVDDQAACLRSRCTPPGLDCVCGFYAFKNRSQAVELLHELHVNRPQDLYGLLSADLDGEVLEYEHGFRAQRQRIVRIELPQHCSQCPSHAGAPSEAMYLTHPQFRIDHLGTTRDVQSHSALPKGFAPVRALCQLHLPSEEMHILTLMDLRARIGTEVALLPAEDQPPRRQESAA
ncbi:MAG: hypothetical protein WBG57_09170 [Ornithinimicrobium sp.]